jgi:hypothetical protein
MSTRKILKKMEMFCFFYTHIKPVKSHISMGNGNNAHKIVRESSH